MKKLQKLKNKLSEQNLVGVNQMHYITGMQNRYKSYSVCIDSTNAEDGSSCDNQHTKTKDYEDGTSTTTVSIVEFEC